MWKESCSQVEEQAQQGQESESQGECQAESQEAEAEGPEAEGYSGSNFEQRHNRGIICLCLWIPESQFIYLFTKVYCKGKGAAKPKKGIAKQKAKKSKPKVPKQKGTVMFKLWTAPQSGDNNT